jgi:hypothetical protein
VFYVLLGTWCCKEIRCVARYAAVCYSILTQNATWIDNVSFIFVKVSNSTDCSIADTLFKQRLKNYSCNLVVYVLMEVSLSWLWSRTVLFHSAVGHHWCSQVPHKSYILRTMNYLWYDLFDQPFAYMSSNWSPLWYRWRPETNFGSAVSDTCIGFAISGKVKLEDYGMYENYVTLEQWNEVHCYGCFYIY